MSPCVSFPIQPVNKTITKEEMAGKFEFCYQSDSLSQIFIPGHRNSQFLNLLDQVSISFTRLPLMIMIKVRHIFAYSGCHTRKLHIRHHINLGGLENYPVEIWSTFQTKDPNVSILIAGCWKATGW